MLIDDGTKTSPSKIGFSVGRSAQGHQGEGVLYSAPYDVVILDLTLPGMDDRDILREWREKGQHEPILILTAHDALAERVEGLYLGADGYLCRPFALVEVAVRLETLTRWINGQVSNELHHGDVVLGPNKRIAMLAGGPLTLKPKEFALLESPIRNVGRMLPCRLIKEKPYIWDEEITSSTVEVHAHHLRRKLGSDPIHTVHGVGYTLGKEWNLPNVLVCVSGWR